MRVCSGLCVPVPAHPRSRGEHGHLRMVLYRLFGSSPLARGTCRPPVTKPPLTRLIPARAGNILVFLRTAAPCSAHPRSRGEHVYRFGFGAHFFGSSPLARGTFEKVAHQRNLPRLIPARAGNIIGLSQRWQWSPAHPRSRGEHGFRAVPALLASGSSPLARGTFRLDTVDDVEKRLIPARAGNIRRPRGSRGP